MAAFAAIRPIAGCGAGVSKTDPRDSVQMAGTQSRRLVPLMLRDRLRSG